MSPVSAHTTVCAVLGRPVRHSLSPAIFNAAFAESGLDWVYVAFEVGVTDLVAALHGVRALGMAGLSVTMPAKEEATRLVDELSAPAAKLGALNCVANVDGRLVGHNTDGPGFVDALAADPGFDVHGCRAVVLGSGGAARAVVLALAGAGAGRVVVVGRSTPRVDRASMLAGEVGATLVAETGSSPGLVTGGGAPVAYRGAALAAELEQADLVVNATPVGMGSDPTLPVEPEVLATGVVVVDLVYHPRRTALLGACAARGIRGFNGVGMLVHQAAHQYRIWTGLEPPLAAMAAATERALDVEASAPGGPESGGR